MSEKDNPEQEPDESEPSMMGVLGNALRGLDPDADGADGTDRSDDASGVEVPQDGDPDR